MGEEGDAGACMSHPLQRGCEASGVPRCEGALASAARQFSGAWRRGDEALTGVEGGTGCLRPIQGRLSHKTGMECF
jgi:hypothetical protein